MNANKVLCAGLLAAVLASAASACGSQGFYIGAGAGVAMSKAHGIIDSKLPEDAHTAGKLVEYKSPTGKKVRFLGELFVGYDHCFKGRVKLGVDLSGGVAMGKMNVKSRTKDEKSKKVGTTSARLRSNWHVALMPRIGLMVMPDLEICGVFGAKVASWKVECPKDMKKPFNGGNVCGRSRLRVQPVIGLGVRYDFADSFFAKLDATYDFRKGMRLPGAKTPVLAKLKAQSYNVRLSLGYKL